MIGRPIAVVCWLSLTLYCPAQSALPTDYGTQAFRAIMHRLGLQPVNSIEAILDKPKKSLLVVFGDTDVKLDYLNHGGLRNFLKKGGACLFASDQTSHRLLQNELEITINGTHVYVHGPNHGDVYRDMYVECPYLKAPIRDNVRSKTINLLQGLERVATNRPSFFNLINEEQRTLSIERDVAESPRNYVIGRRGSIQNPPPPTLQFAIAELMVEGRYCVITDHSIFINSMLLQSDNDNIAFTNNVLNWLTENGKRNQVLFLDDGQTRTEFDFNLDYLEPPLPHPDVLAPAIDKLIVGLEQDNFFNRTIERLIPLPRLLRHLLLGFTVGMAALVLYRITAGKHRREANVNRLPDRVESLADTIPLDEKISQTTDPVVLATVGRELINRTFCDLLGQDKPKHPYVVAGGFWTRRKWSRRVDELWNLGFEQTRRTMSPAELKSLARQLDDLKRAAERGVIQLMTVEEPG